MAAIETRESSQERALAGSAPTQHGDEFAIGDAEVKAVEDDILSMEEEDFE